MTTSGNANGSEVKDLRLRAGLSQQRLAQLARCSLSMVRLIESGYQPQDSGVTSRILKALEKAAV